MAIIGANAQVLLDGKAISRDVAKALVTFLADEVDHTRMGQLGSYWKSHLVTQNDGKVSLNGDLPSVDVDALLALQNLINRRTLHQIALHPFGGYVGNLSIFANVRATKPAEVGMSVNGIVSLDTDFITSAASPGMAAGLIAWAPAGAGSLTTDTTMALVFSGVSETLGLGFLDPGNGQISGSFTAASDNSTLETLLESIYGEGSTVNVTGSLTSTGSSPNRVFTGALNVDFGGSLAGVPEPLPVPVTAATQAFTVAGGDTGDYTLNGGAPVQLGITAADMQTNQRNLAGKYSAVTVSGSSSAPANAVQQIALVNVPSTARLGVKATGGSNVQDVADPTSNADWTAAIEANTSYSGRSVAITGTVTNAGGYFNGTLTLTFDGQVSVPLVTVVQGAAEEVTATAAVTIDGVTVTPGDELATIQTNLQGAGGPDAAVLVTGTSTAGSGGHANELIFALGGEFDGTFVQTGTYAGFPYFVNGGWYLFWLSGNNSWCVAPALGDGPGNNGSGWIHAYLPQNGTDDSSNPAGLATSTTWAAFEVGTAGPGTVTYTGAVGPTGGDLDIFLFYPASVGAVTPTVTGGTLTQDTAGGSVPSGASTSQTTVGGSGGAADFISIFPASAGSVAAPTATGTAATATTTQAGGQPATGLVESLIQEAATFSNANIISSTGPGTALRDIPANLTSVHGLAAIQETLYVSPGGSLTQVLEHSPDDGDGNPTTWSILLAFEAVTESGAAILWLPAGTTIYPHIRVNNTALTGEAIAAVGFSRI